ncbi:ferritin-like domain-containing protein [Hymenobacter sp. IS2118]|uniref:ferritin-like domain-containing protein n=1 Tax=Hymenobacter sp. IS2118 TaxID=1505605 RepID=UPI00068FAC9D|nr:PA2169 family four-helix-bundle protein [Hymenobacter sp. IS2118]
MNQPQASATDNSKTAASFFAQARQWLREGSMSQLLGQVPASLKNAGRRTASGFNKLSTTQKLAGGAALLVGATLLARHKQGSRTSESATLKELLYFVNDRIEGYRHAVEESQDSELRNYYLDLVTQSQQFANQLNVYLSQEGGSPQTSTTIKGKLYRAWMDAKAALTNHDEKAILGSNIYGEEWALKAYEEALHDNTLTGVMRQVVERQYAQSQKTYYKLQDLQAKE